MEATHQTPQENGASSKFSPLFWIIPADSDKPHLPYLPGFSIQIHRHSPPPAYATAEELDKLGYQERVPIKGDDLYDVTQSEDVALNPPVDGVPLSRPGRHS